MTSGEGALAKMRDLADLVSNPTDKSERRKQAADSGDNYSSDEEF